MLAVCYNIFILWLLHGFIWLLMVALTSFMDAECQTLTVMKIRTALSI